MAKLIGKKDITIPIRSLTDIHPDPDQPRKVFPIEKIDEIGRSIKENGQRNRIHVWQHPSFVGYRIINGECRYQGSFRIGMPTIEAIEFIFEGELEDIKKLIFEEQIMDNENRKNFEPLEFLEALQKAIDNGSTVESLSKKFGRSKDLIEKDLPILKLPSLLLTAFNKGEIPKDVARKLAELPSHQAMNKAWDWACKMKNSAGMLAKIKSYQNQKAQTNIFDDALDEATSPEKKEAKITADKLMRAIVEFNKTPFANGKGELLMVVNSRKLDGLKILAADMAKISAKLKSDILAYESQRKNAVA